MNGAPSRRGESLRACAEFLLLGVGVIAGAIVLVEVLDLVLDRLHDDAFNAYCRLDARRWTFYCTADQETNPSATNRAAAS